jgi:hypothetical protein
MFACDVELRSVSRTANITVAIAGMFSTSNVLRKLSLFRTLEYCNQFEWMMAATSS